MTKKLVIRYDSDDFGQWYMVSGAMIGFPWPPPYKQKEAEELANQIAAIPLMIRALEHITDVYEPELGDEALREVDMDLIREALQAARGD